jgi:uncharacterized protein (TIGR00369 family)
MTWHTGDAAPPDRPGPNDRVTTGIARPGRVPLRPEVGAVPGSDTRTVTVEFDPDDYERLLDAAEDPTSLVYEAAMARVDLEEAIAFTRDGGFQGPDGFQLMADDEYPNWPLGSLLGIELRSMGDGECRWTVDVGPEHANPMGTLHGGVLCDVGDAALSTAYMSTLDPGRSFTTVDLTVNFLRPVWEERLEAVGRVVHRGRTIGVSECEIETADGDQVARLTGTCMTLAGDAADRTDPEPE